MLICILSSRGRAPLLVRTRRSAEELADLLGAPLRETDESKDHRGGENRRDSRATVQAGKDRRKVRAARLRHRRATDRDQTRRTHRAVLQQHVAVLHFCFLQLKGWS